MVKGQLMEVVHKKEEGGNWWEYGVVLRVFDKKVQIKTETNKNIMHSFDIEDEEGYLGEEWYANNIKIVELYKDGQIVMAKRGMLGGYKFK